MASIRVLVVEDSLTQRHQLVSLIQSAPGMAVVGQARDGLEAVQFVEELRPDVISMDIRMPRLGGLEATRQIMESFPTPIVIVSHASSDAQVAMQAMQAGALAAVEKPPMKGHPDYAARCDELVSMLRLMSGVRVIRHWSDPSTRAVKGDTQELKADHSLKAAAVSQPLLKRQTGRLQGLQPEIVAIGASAGGPGTLARILGALPADFHLPILIVQHLTREFMPGLAEWLDRAGPLSVRLPTAGEMPHPGTVLVAPGSVHLRVSADRRIVLDSDRGVYRHHPAVDVLFDSVARHYGQSAIGIILTGMGDDGAAGLQALRQAGARTIVQDEATCIVFGMPAAAIALGAAEYVLPLDRIAPAILELSGRGEGRNFNANGVAR